MKKPMNHRSLFLLGPLFPLALATLTECGGRSGLPIPGTGSSKTSLSSSSSSSSSSSASGSTPLGVNCGTEILCAGVCVDLASDPNNCGACGHGCQGGTCAGSLCQPVVLAANLTEPISLAVDATNVYWATSGTEGGGPGQIQSVPIDGGSPNPS